jgi:hypothetical protein
LIVAIALPSQTLSCAWKLTVSVFGVMLAVVEALALVSW